MISNSNIRDGFSEEVMLLLGLEREGVVCQAKGNVSFEEERDLK